MSKPYPDAAATGFAWFKSTHSSGEQSCVETAAVPGVVPVRDSKTPKGPALAFAPAAWAAFIEYAKSHA